MNEDKDVDMVCITPKEYKQLIEDSQFMRALEAAGVDNWDGYDIAQDMLEEWNKENE